MIEASSSALGFLIHEVARLMRRRFEQHARGFGLTRSQRQALAYLSRNEGISQTGLADLLDIEPITLGRIIWR
jgi:MarR family transcriptional regulator for hemolysin